MAIVGDVFGLNAVYDRQVENVENNNFASWPEGASYGYIGAGRDVNGNITTVARIDFFNETISTPGNNFPAARPNLAAVSSDSYGYFGAGGPSSSGAGLSTIERLDFSNETLSSPGNDLPQGRIKLAATSSDSYGYFAGGEFFPPGRLATIDRIDFSNETTSAPGNNLPQARERFAAVSSDSYGYFGGGINSIGQGTGLVERIDFFNETISSPGNNFINALKYDWAAVSSDSYGYFGGGPGTFNLDIDRIDFINETTTGSSDSPGELSLARQSLAATSSNSYGYFVGGIKFPSPSNVTTIDRIDFSNETMSLPGNNLPGSGRYSAAGVSGGASILRGKGYKTYGYFAGGGSNPIGLTPFFSKIERIDFSSEVFSVLSNSLPQTIRGINAVSSNSYGYYCGGLLPPQTSKIDRIDYSNETLLTPGNDLSQRVAGTGTLSNSFYGYLGGGFSPSVPGRVCTIDRLDFSSETVSIPNNNLPQARSGLSATSSNSYGYFGGGGFTNPPAFPVPLGVTCAIDRLDFSNETVSTPGNNLSQSVIDFASLSNTSYGYFGGGRFNGPPDPLDDISSSVDRLDFSTETTSSLGTILPYQRMFLLAGTSSSFYGYFGGGYSTPFTLSNVNRLDFSNDTMSAQSNKLVNQTYDMGATSNSN